MNFTATSGNLARFEILAQHGERTGIGVAWSQTPSIEDAREAEEWFGKTTGSISEGSVRMENHLARQVSAEIYVKTGCFKDPTKN